MPRKPAPTYLINGKKKTALQIVNEIEAKYENAFDCYDQKGVISYWLAKGGVALVTQTLIDEVSDIFDKRCDEGEW